MPDSPVPRTTTERLRVLVSGASGVIGSALVPALRSAGHDVQRLVRRSGSAPDAIPWDPSAAAMDPAPLEGADAVIHLAAENIGHRWTADRRRRIVESRVQGTALLATTLAQLQRPPRVLICASAIGVYGDRGDEELTETSTPGTDFLARTVEQWEACTRVASASGIRVVLARSGAVVATGGGALARMLPFFRLGVGGRLGSGKQWMSWISMEDEIRAMMFAIGDPTLSGAVNFVSPRPVRNAEFTRTLGHVLGRPAVIPVPTAALLLAFGEMASQTVLASQRVFPNELHEHGFEFSQPELEQALRFELSR